MMKNMQIEQVILLVIESLFVGGLLTSIFKDILRDRGLKKKNEQNRQEQILEDLSSLKKRYMALWERVVELEKKSESEDRDTWRGGGFGKGLGNQVGDIRDEK